MKSTEEFTRPTGTAEETSRSLGDQTADQQTLASRSPTTEGGVGGVREENGDKEAPSQRSATAAAEEVKDDGDDAAAGGPRLIQALFPYMGPLLFLYYFGLLRWEDTTEDVITRKLPDGSIETIKIPSATTAASSSNAKDDDWLFNILGWFLPEEVWTPIFAMFGSVFEYLGSFPLFSFIGSLHTSVKNKVDEVAVSSATDQHEGFISQLGFGGDLLVIVVAVIFVAMWRTSNKVETRDATVAADERVPKKEDEVSGNAAKQE